MMKQVAEESDNSVTHEDVFHEMNHLLMRSYSEHDAALRTHVSNSWSDHMPDAELHTGAAGMNTCFWLVDINQFSPLFGW